MAKNEEKININSINKRKKTLRKIKLSLCIILVCLIVLYIILVVIYEEGRFTVSLDKNLMMKKGITLYENSETKESKEKLQAGKIDFMDNISIKWIHENINNEADGAHNGENYIAYTFYISNNGEEEVDYWSEIIIDDVIKDVDEAVRVMVYLNDERTVYAKKNSVTGQPEKDTKAFYSDTDVMLENRKGFKPGQTDKYTIVVWLEGDDPDCVNALLGGEIKMHMDIKEEHVEQK